MGTPAKYSNKVPLKIDFALSGNQFQISRYVDNAGFLLKTKCIEKHTPYCGERYVGSEHIQRATYPELEEISFDVTSFDGSQGTGRVVFFTRNDTHPWEYDLKAIYELECRLIR